MERISSYVKKLKLFLVNFRKALEIFRKFKVILIMILLVLRKICFI